MGTLKPVLSGVLVLAALRCGPEKPSPVPMEEAILLEQQEGLRRLIREAQAGPLLRFEDVLVVVDQGLIEDLLSATMPIERVLRGAYRVRILSAAVAFEDGLPLVRLEGRASFADRPEEEAVAELSVVGGLDVIELDAVSGTLRGRLRLIGFEAKRLAILGLDAPGRQLVEQLARERLESFDVLTDPIEIPVRLEREVRLPGVGPEGGVYLEAVSIPLQVGVLDVKAFKGKLWVAVRASAQKPETRQDAPGAGER